MRLHDETTWPTDVVDCLRRYESIFDDWHGPAAQTRERLRRAGEDPPHVFGALEYDRAIRQLDDVLRAHTLDGGFHCARLTSPESAQIREHGLGLPDGNMLRARIAALERAGIVTKEIAARFSRENHADVRSRARKIWFVFFEPHLAGQDGAERFFRSWGGEALYSSHERDPETGPCLRRIGTPCLVLADVPIASLRPGSSLSIKLVTHYFVNRGFVTLEPVDHEDCAVHPLSATDIRGVVQFPSSDFTRLTHCDTWNPPLE